MHAILRRVWPRGPRVAALLAILATLGALIDVASAQVCQITGSLKLCGGASGEICGPPGMASYAWSGPQGFVATTQCITISVVGVYTLTITDNQQGSFTCSGNVTRVPEAVCAITPTNGTSLCATGSVELCGPANMIEYKWSGPNDYTASTQCITVSTPGTYTLTITNEDDCGATCEETVTGDGGTCVISGPSRVCSGQTIQLCGPEGGDSYTWSGPGEFTGDTRCVTVSAGGTYELTVVSAGGCTSTCAATVTEEVCQGENCPRTPGFWSAQCAQKDNGSTKFTREEMDDITACVDEHSDFFDWAADFDGFCAVVDPPRSMDIRKQTLRHYAVLLANVCTGELGVPANNGDLISLSLDTPIDCDGLDDVHTIGELIAEAEQRLAELDGDPLTDEVKSEYESLKNCMDDINNGRGIGPTCSEEGGDKGKDQAGGSILRPGGDRSGRPVLALHASPNPFNGSVTIGYAVPTQGDAFVSVTIYDAAGRMVRQLVSGTFAPGPYAAKWDGRDASGRTAASGVYYARAQVGDLKAVTRLLLVQ